MGGGSDLPDFYRKYTGASLTFTINRYVYLAINTPFADEIRLAYSRNETVKDVMDIDHPIFRHSLKALNIQGKIEIGSFADVPSSGSGLGSSSAFTAALLSGLHTFNNQTFDKQKIATLACDIEIKHCGDPIGKQDQYATAYGGFNSFRFNPDESVNVEQIDLSIDTTNTLRQGFFLIYLGFGRGSNQILANQITNLRNASSNAVALTSQLRDMVPFTRKALQHGDLESLGGLLNESWTIKKQLSKGISNSEIDALYSQLIRWGASGGKLLGAGGGGFLFMCVPFSKQETFRECLEQNDLRNIFQDFDYDGSKTILR